jgi:tetratricopeptide (TPR) repeat protein
LSDTTTPAAGTFQAGFAEAAALQSRSAFAEAAEAYLRLTRRAVTVALASNLSVCLTELGRFDEAAHWLLMAARHRPGDPDLRRLLGNLYVEAGRLEMAELEYRTALVLDPDQANAAVGLGALLLSQGRYAEGWPLFEKRAGINPDLVPQVSVSFPEWTGEPLAGKSILVWYEQGLGDQIQMCRFAAMLKARGAAHVALGCRPTLVDLLATTPGADEIIPAPQGAAVSIRAYDYWTRFFSLPGRLGVTLETLPAEPYLSAPADRRARWAGARGVGLAWRASPTGFNARNKTLPDALAQRLLDAGAMSLDPADTGVADFADTAAIVEQLDLVISIDSSVAHLAGAMGKPCWTLLPRLHCDWRWLRGRSDSPWYPTMRLYRQTTPGDWRPLIAQVATEMAAMRTA